MNGSESEETGIFAPGYGSWYGPSFLAVTILGIISNSVVVAAFISKILPLTPFCILLLNLSVSDIFINIFMLPSFFVRMSDYREVDQPYLTSFMCGIVFYHLIARSGFIVNVMTLAYVSFIRSTTFDFKHRGRILNPKTVKWFILYSWIIALLLHFPWYFMYELNPTTGHCNPKYYEVYSIYHASQVSITYVILEIILFVNMVRSVRNMWKKSISPHSIILQKRHRVTSLLLALGLVYIVLCLPVSVVMIMEASGYFQSADSFNDVYFPSVLVVYLNTVVDPFMYIFYWKGFRNGFMTSRKKMRETATRLPSSDKADPIDTKVSAVNATNASKSTMNT